MQAVYVTYTGLYVAYAGVHVTYAGIHVTYAGVHVTYAWVNIGLCYTCWGPWSICCTHVHAYALLMPDAYFGVNNQAIWRSEAG